MNHARHRRLVAFVALAPLGWSAIAQAKPEFPGDIKVDLTPNLSYQVPCSVCHIKGNTGSSTAIMPFALSLRARGMTGQTTSLKTALTQLETDGVDSDGDGTTDVQELQDGTDPNSSANASINGDTESGYGCGGTAPHGGANRGPAAASVVGISLLLLRRCRGRS
jgi:hypothetical protein